MQIELTGKLAELLEQLATSQTREVNEIVQEAVEEYLLRQKREADFDSDIRRIIKEHHWLLDRLAE